MLTSVLAELKRRNVFRAAAAYLAVAWLLIQVAETTFPAFGFDERALRLLIVVLAIGLVPAVAFAWAFELTPEGFKREREMDRSSPLALRTNRLLDRTIVALLAIGVTYFAIDKFVLSPAREQARVEQAREQGRSEALTGALADKSIVVLPFANLSADPEQAYFADGMAEELLNLLARIPELRVISRTSAFAFKDKEVPITEIARQLKVSYVLEGSVRRSGDRLRIAAQLIDARSDSHLWSETYDRQLDDVFVIQDEIAGHVVAALELKLLGAGAKRRTADPRAYALYVQARQMLDSGFGNYGQVNDLLQRALEIDPDAADTWGALSWLLYRCFREGPSGPDGGFCGTMPRAELIAKSEAALDRALEIDPANAAALSAKAWLGAVLGRGLQSTATQFENVFRLRPTQTDVMRPAMVFANALRRPEVSIRIGEYIVPRDPLCAVCNFQLARAYVAAGRFRDAETILRDSVASGRGGGFLLGMILLLDERPQEALEEFSQQPGRAMRLAGEAMALHSLGRAAESGAALSELEASHGATNAKSIAEVHAWLGRRDAAAAWLRKALESADKGNLIEVLGLLESPVLIPVFDHPDVDPILRRLGVASDQLAAVRFDPLLPG